MVAGYRARVAPFNVNYRYVEEELLYLLTDARTRALVYHADFAPRVGAIRDRLPDLEVLIQVADDSGNDLLPGAVDYETVLATPAPAAGMPVPSGDDLSMLYTGGTTGMPKGVMWRNDDLYRALWQMGRPGTEPPDPVASARAGKRTGTCLPACPLMHGTGLFIALSTLAGAGTVVLVDSPGLDAALLWAEVERNRVAVLTIVGDVFARPLLDVLDAAPDRYDLGSLRAITSSGVTWSPETKAGLLRHLPDVTLIDSLGASEGLMSRSAATADAQIKPARFAVNDRVRVLDEKSGRPVTPGTDQIGLVAVTGALPLGYYKDEAKTAATFRTYDGVRYSIPGDYGTVDADGTIRLLGRGSACINTGGEKVYPEEVELLLREHAAVGDCLVVGVPDDRYGEMVVALVVAAPGHDLDETTLDAFCRGRLSGYKRPKRFFVIDDLERSAAGKANYRTARARASELVADG
jgi:fatty-acyl-CoA synthase